nr:transposase domain-containing protein [Rhizobium rhizoryzae]
MAPISVVSRVSPDLQAWLAEVLARIANTPISRLEELLPSNWKHNTLSAQAD